jgi:hypothetical protein
MTPALKTALKKRRDFMRKRLRADIQNLIAMSEGELGEYEATHAILDSILDGLNDRVASGLIKPTLEFNIAQTYLEHTKHEAGLAAGDTEPATAHPKKWASKLGLKKANTPSYPTFIDDPTPEYPKGPETAKLYITKNLADWEFAQNHVYAQGWKSSVVGGLVAKTTIEKYGYVPEDGYEFQSWSTGESKLVKSTPKASQQQVHLCGSGGCADFTVSKGAPYQISGQAAYSLGLKFSHVQDTLTALYPDLKVEKLHNKDLLLFSFKEDSPDPAYKTTNYFLQANALPSAWVNSSEGAEPLTKEKLDVAIAKVQAGTFNKYDPATYPVTNSEGFTSDVPFKTWLTMHTLGDLNVASVNLPPGLMWHSHYASGADKYDPDKSMWWLDYKGSPTPVPPGGWDGF